MTPYGVIGCERVKPLHTLSSLTLVSQRCAEEVRHRWACVRV